MSIDMPVWLWAHWALAMLAWVYIGALLTHEESCTEYGQRRERWGSAYDPTETNE